MTIRNSVVTLTPYTTSPVTGFQTAGTPINKKAYVEKVSMSNYGAEGVPTNAEWIVMLSADNITITEEWHVTEIRQRGKLISTGDQKIKKIFGPIAGTYWTYWEIYV